VVRRGFQALEDVGVHASIQARASDDLVEEFGADAARAAEGQQQAARVQEFEGQAVDVLVGAAGVQSAT
jgi:hypothetical protein